MVTRGCEALRTTYPHPHGWPLRCEPTRRLPASGRSGASRPGQVNPGEVLSRVGRGGFPPRPPTDPCMPNSGTRLFRPRIRPWPCGHGPVMLSAVVALRWNQGSVSPASFPPAVSWPGVPFPLRGPSGRLPRVTGNMRRSDSLPPLPPHFVAFVWRYPGRIRVSFPWPPEAPAAGLELVTRYLPPGHCREDGGASQVPGGPP